MSRPITQLRNIEDAAVRLFASRGLSGVTVSEIAKEAGCAEGTLYRHYESKEELAWVLYKREVARFSKALKSVLENAEDYQTRIRQSINLFCDFFDREPVTFSFILLTQHGFQPNRKLNPDSNPEHLVFQFLKAGFHLKHPQLTTALLLGLILQPAIMCAEGKLKSPMKQWAVDIFRACSKLLIEKEK